MTITILRGRLLSFHQMPQAADDHDAYFFEEDGAIAIEHGVIIERGTFDHVNETCPDSDIIDHRPHLICPGFIDTHAHFPQVQVIGSYAAQLLDWLNDYTFVEEQKYADPAHCKRMAKVFFDALISHGTTTCVAYCSVHKSSATAFFEEAEARHMRMIGGKVMMDRNAPGALTDTPQSGYDESKELIETWHGRGRACYAISPRFAITSTPSQMEMAQALVREHPDCYMQTHLSENRDEISYAKELYPSARDYLDIYEKYELLGPKSLFGHCIHLEPREIKALAQSRSIAVFCPTSNLFLGSGLFDLFGLEKENVRTSIATDIGGGTSYSMLKTLDEAYKITQLRQERLFPLKAFYMLTLGNAEALCLADKIGTLDSGTEADLVVLDSCATSAMALRMQTAKTLSEELFILQTMGDDRAVRQTYIAGKAMKSADERSAHFHYLQHFVDRAVPF